MRRITLKILFISSAVGPYKDGMTGGVSDLVRNTDQILSKRGYKIDILAGDSSIYDGKGHMIGIPGAYQPSHSDKDKVKDFYPIIPHALINQYCNYAREHQIEYNAILNFCHDWLPYYLTPFFKVPVLHIPNLCDENTVATEQIQYVATHFPWSIACLSKAQAATLGIEGKTRICRCGLDIALYPFQQKAEPGNLIWCGRITPDKGLEDAAEIAHRTKKQLTVCGYMQDADYFKKIQIKYAEVIKYRGFLDKGALTYELGRAEALLCTHKWCETFAMVVLEALACGTPVITYDRGGSVEAIEHQITGYIVPADNIESAVKCVQNLSEIKRENCRRSFEQNYSLDAYGDRLEEWFKGVKMGA